MRKPIQFALMTSNNNPMVLCDDGTLWEGYRNVHGPRGEVMGWRQLPPIPGSVLDADDDVLTGT